MCVYFGYLQIEQDPTCNDETKNKVMENKITPTLLPSNFDSLHFSPPPLESNRTPLKTVGAKFEGKKVYIIYLRNVLWEISFRRAIINF